MIKTITVEVRYESNSEDTEWIEKQLLQLLSTSRRISERTMGEARHLAIAGIAIKETP